MNMYNIYRKTIYIFIFMMKDYMYIYMRQENLVIQHQCTMQL